MSVNGEVPVKYNPSSYDQDFDIDLEKYYTEQKNQRRNDGYNDNNTDGNRKHNKKPRWSLNQLLKNNRGMFHFIIFIARCLYIYCIINSLFY